MAVRQAVYLAGALAGQASCNALMHASATAAVIVRIQSPVRTPVSLMYPDQTPKLQTQILTSHHHNVLLLLNILTLLIAYAYNMNCFLMHMTASRAFLFSSIDVLLTSWECGSLY